MIRLEGGYKTITPIQVANILAALAADRITFRSLRTLFGCLELKAIREAASRVRKLKGQGKGQERFEHSQLRALLPDLSERALVAELRRLSRAKLLSFRLDALEFRKEILPEAEPVLRALNGSRSGTRAIPIPRRVLRFLCRSRKQALVKTLLAYLVRGLSFNGRTGEVRATGSAKVSWICLAFDLSERAVRGARAELIRLGFISKDETSHQRKLNRHGAYFRINFEFMEGRGEGGKVIHNGIKLSPVVGNFDGAENAPPRPEKCMAFAPPLERPETLSDSKDQKLSEADQSGFCGKGRKEKPDLRNIQPEDLRRVSTLKVLFDQAVSAKWFCDSEANFGNFVAAAVRATRVQGDAVRIFVGIVRQGLWSHISPEQEDRARVVINRNREKSRACRKFLPSDLGFGNLGDVMRYLLPPTMDSLSRIETYGATPDDVGAGKEEEEIEADGVAVGDDC